METREIISYFNAILLCLVYNVYIDSWEFCVPISSRFSARYIRVQHDVCCRKGKNNKREEIVVSLSFFPLMPIYENIL